MKLKNIVLLLALLSAIAAKGQDIIYMQNGSQIIAKDVIIKDKNVKYNEGTKYPDGSIEYDIIPQYINLQLVDFVVYSEGDTLFLNTSEETNISSIPTKQNNIDLYNQICYPQYKNPAIAYLFSYIPGGGQFYNDEIAKGFTFMISTGICAGATYGFYEGTKVSKGNEKKGYTQGAIVFGVATAVLYVWQAIDAVVTADKKNRMNGYVLSFTPSIMDNHLACSVDGSGYVPAMSFNLSF